MVTRATKRLYKSDAVHDLLALLSTISPGERVAQSVAFVADVVDAFWLVPIVKDE